MTELSSDTSSETFFSESSNSVDALLEEQDNIIDDLRKENAKLKMDITNLKNNVKEHLVERVQKIHEVYDKIKYTS